MSDDRTRLDAHGLDTAPGDEPAGRGESQKARFRILSDLGSRR